MADKFTPGPWSVGLPRDMASGEIIATAYNLRMCEEDEDDPVAVANGRLMMVAPDFLKALRKIVEIGFSAENNYSAAWQVATDAISKYEEQS